MRRLIRPELISTARAVSTSLTAKLVVIVAIFVVVPIVLYGEFETADSEMRDLVITAIRHQNHIIAAALQPILDQPGKMPNDLSAVLAHYGGDRTMLKLMFQPRNAKGAKSSFYFVGAVPPAPADALASELDELARNGVLQRLSASCREDAAAETRYRPLNGKGEILTAVLPIESRWGCWALVSSYQMAKFIDASIGRPYWETREIRVAAISYLVVALLAGVIALSVWRNIRHFRKVTKKIRQGGGAETSFAARTVIPELAATAADFDRLVLDLHDIARDIRQAAEDNMHSFKTPVATIDAALEPLRRLASDADERTRRALDLIDSSLSRLKTLITAAQRLDNVTADLIDAPRARVNLTMITAETLLRYRDIMAERGITLVRRVDDNVFVDAGAGALETIIENLLDNAISFSPRGSVITVTLAAHRQSAALKVADEGPGVDPNKIGRIFERYCSLRPKADTPAHRGVIGVAAEHAGLGLWIVRRNVQALGGTVTAINRIGGGFCVDMVLPLGLA